MRIPFFEWQYFVGYYPQRQQVFCQSNVYKNGESSIKFGRLSVKNYESALAIIIESTSITNLYNW